jgi:hypothetical protein
MEPVTPYAVGTKVVNKITGVKGKIESFDPVKLTYEVVYANKVGLRRNQPHATIEPIKSTKKIRLASYNGFIGKVFPYLQYEGNEALFGRRNSLSWENHDCVRELAWLVGWVTLRGFMVIWTTEQHKPRVIADAARQNVNLDGVMFVGEKSDSTAYHCKFMNPGYAKLDVILGKFFDPWGGGGSGLEINSRNFYDILADIGHPLREGVMPTEDDLRAIRSRVVSALEQQAGLAVTEVIRYYDKGVAGILPEDAVGVPEEE